MTDTQNIDSGEIEEAMKFVGGSQLDLSQTAELDLPDELEEKLEEANGVLNDAIEIADRYLEEINEAA